MAEEGDASKWSSSPLKRRASTMTADSERPAALQDVEMVNASAPVGEGGEPQQRLQGGSEGVDVEEEGIRAMNIDSAESPRHEHLDPAIDQRSPTPPPPIGEQIITIQSLLKLFGQEPLAPGVPVWYVSKSWLEKAMELGEGGDGKEPAKDADAELQPLGPVDNSDIIRETFLLPNGHHFVRLKEGTDRENFEPFPSDAWETLIKWHGLKEGQHPIERRAVDVGAGETAFEHHPLILTFHLAWSPTSPYVVDPSIKSPPLRIAVSRKEHFQTVLKAVKDLLAVPMERKVRLWKVTPPSGSDTQSSSSSNLTPPASPPGGSENGDPTGPWSDMMVEASTVFTLERPEGRELVSMKDQTADSNYNGKSTVDFFIDGDCTLVVDQETGKNSYVLSHTSASEAGTAAGRIIAAKGSKGYSSTPTSGRSSPTGFGPAVRGGRMQPKRHGRGKGVVGFHNLGNTCYMNSALQCMRSVEELSKYFLSGEYKKEINDDNPLGYGGAVAHSYGKLIKEVYDAGRTSLSPKNFRNTVGNFRSQFASWSQQDTQEFLGFMLDALQEDLSRVKKKPYIEKPDSTDDMINDPAAVKAMADQVWDITRLRDDSVIADLFTGMYKSTLKCPECGKISITFDPFNNLTLPLPIETMHSVTIRFFPLNDPPVDVDVEIPQHSAIELLKEFLSERLGVPVDRLLGGEEYKDRFFKIYHDWDDVSEEIKANDLPTFHELEAVPTNARPAAAQQSMSIKSMLDIDTPVEDPRCERMAIPVVHRVKGMTPKNISRSSTGMPPHFIMVTKEEAFNEDVIRRKILEKIATLSTWSVLKEDAADADAAADSDLTAVSDSELSSGPAKVVASSVRGEDDLVDVTMDDGPAHQGPPGTPGYGPRNQQPHEPSPSSNTPSSPPSPSKILKHFHGQRPKFITQPDSFLAPELQNLFELCYFTDRANGAAIPSGWQTTNTVDEFPTLASRVPASPDPGEDNPRSPTSSASTGSSAGDESEDEAGAPDEQTRMADESSEDDATPPPIQRNGHGPRGFNKRGGGKKKFKAHKTYGKHGNKRRNQQMQAERQYNKHFKDRPKQRHPSVRPQPSTPGALIRLGEGIVVDWYQDAWTKVFEGSGNSVDLRGTRTFVNPERLRDVVLDRKRKARISRRSRGITLDECLDEFEKAEVLSAQDMWYCPRCKEHRRASKKFDLWKTPDILVCHLKRFSANRRDKLDILVDFPFEGLDLTKRVLNREEGKEEVYDLIAVDDHFGGLGGGHYTAYSRNFVDGMWYNYNDSSASMISDPVSAMSTAAYLLFYRRRSNAPLGGPRFADIIRRYDDGSDGDDSASGEDQRLVGGSSRLGSSSAGKGAVATLPRAGRGLASTSSAASFGAIDDDDDDLDVPPAYQSAVRLVGPRNQVYPDEGVELDEHAESRSAYQQSWSWGDAAAAGDNLSTGNNADAEADDYPSDRVENDSEGGSPRFPPDDSFMDADSDAAGALILNGQRHLGADEFADVIGAPGSPVDPEVAEIRLDSSASSPEDVPKTL